MQSYKFRCYLLSFQASPYTINLRQAYKQQSIIKHQEKDKMISQIQKSKMMEKYLSMKSPRNGASRQYLRQYLFQNYDLYEELFDLLKDNESFYLKPEPLRHPLIFYYGHTASFFINKLVDRGLIDQPIDQVLQATLAVGVDEMDWDDLDKTQYHWPTVQKVKQYRTLVRQKLNKVVDTIDLKISYDSDLWVLLMGIEHEKVHFETSAAIIRRLPIEKIKPSSTMIDCPIYRQNIEQIPENSMKTVKAMEYKWGRQSIKNADYYGWDNQFGDMHMKTPQFSASKMLVSNGQFLQFVNDNGYSRDQFWDNEGKAWLKSTKTLKPIFWVKSEDGYKLRTMNKLIKLPMDWPVQVNNLEASAFCNWKGNKIGKKLRLPTEQQYHAIRELLPYDMFDWEHGKVGNINMEVWNSPCPVNMFQKDGFYDIVGNVWQHTCTPLYPFKDFEIHPYYEDYSTPTFDCRHYLIKGGSFATIGDTAFKHARDAFRRHFYQFAGFRYVQSPVQPTIPAVLLHETDQKVENSLRLHYQQTNSYIQHSIRLIKEVFTDSEQKFIHVGCSVGMMVLEMSKHFAKSYGTDFSTRYFQMVSRMLQKGQLSYRDLKVTTEKISPKNENIILYQANPQNPDKNKLNNFKVVVIDGLSIKQNSMNKVINKFLPLMKQDSYLLLVNAESCNNVVTPQQMKQIQKNAELIDQRSVPIQKNCAELVKLDLFQIKSF